MTAKLKRGTVVKDVDTQYVSVKDPSVSIVGLDSSIDEDDSDSFTVSAYSLVSDNSYNIRVTTDSSDIGFNSTCSDRQEDITVTAGSNSFSSNSLTLYGCEADGGTVTANLRRGSTVVDTATRDVDVEAASTPVATPVPTVTIAAVESPVTEGENAEFTVTASSAPSSNLTVNVQVTDSGSFIQGTSPTSVTISANAATSTLTVPTDDDTADEVDGSITATILTGTGYSPVSGTSASDSVTVEDNDEPTTSNTGGTSTTTPDRRYFDFDFRDWQYMDDDTGFGIRKHIPRVWLLGWGIRHTQQRGILV